MPPNDKLVDEPDQKIMLPAQTMKKDATKDHMKPGIIYTGNIRKMRGSD